MLLAVPPVAHRSLLFILAAPLGAALLIAAASGGHDGRGRAPLVLPVTAPRAVVAGGATPWVRGGPTNRAALHTGWRVRMDPADSGGRRGWAHGGFGGQPVTVPFVPNARMPVTSITMKGAEHKDGPWASQRPSVDGSLHIPSQPVAAQGHAR